MKLVTTGFLMAANYLWIMNVFNQHPVLKYIVGAFCFTGAVSFLAVPFLKPKKIGRLEIGPNGMEFNSKENQVKITLPQIKELDFKCRGFKRWRNHAAHGNRNYLILKTIEDNYFEFEILVKSTEHKDTLTGMLAAQKDNRSLNSFISEEEVYAG